ncbi:MAG: hypothetical protein GVY25_15515 [Bacteroidetes bacterium]|jgi:hypothetical protein|nr:hypothetical protein [Bacteroidota bacterium]
MTHPESNTILSLASCLRMFPTLMGLLVGALVFSAGCAQVEETVNQTPQEEQTNECPADFDNFAEDFSDHVDRQRDRDANKALAYARESQSGCFTTGYGYDQSSRRDAVTRALSECRSYKSEGEDKYGVSYGECTLYSVNGQRQ